MDLNRKLYSSQHHQSLIYVKSRQYMHITKLPKAKQ